jgi:large subunit ribosomal protein L4
MSEIKAPLFAADGTAKGDVTLDAEVFGIEPNMAVMHQVVTAQLAGARSGTASTKTRAEVRGGGRKPWRQKGLGRARQGSIRAPHWAGGGIAHGPKPRDYSQRTPKKMKRLALRSALSARASEAAIVVVEPLLWDTPKTKQAVSFLTQIGATGKTLLVVDRHDDAANRAFRNLRSVLVAEPGHVTTYDVLWSDRVVFTTDTVGRVGRPQIRFEVASDDFVREPDAPVDNASEPATASEGGES